MFTLSHIVFRAWVALCLLLSFTATQDASAASSSKYDEIVNKGWKEIDMDQNHMYGIYNPEHAMSMDEAEVYLAGQFKQVYGKHKEYLRATGQEDTVSSVFMETNSTATKANAKGWYKGRPSLEELEEKESIEFLNRWEDARYQYHFGGSNPSSASSAFVEKSSRAGRTTARSKAGPGSDLDDEDSDSGDMGSVSGNTVSSSSSSDSKDSDVDSDVDSVSDGSVASSSSSDSIDSWQAEWKAQQDVVDTSGNMLDGLKGKEANVMFTHESSSTYLNRQKEAVAEIFKQPPSQVSTFVCSAFDVSLLPITGLPVVATFSLDGTINYNVANKCWGITSSMGFGLYITLPFLSKFFALAIYFKGTGGISEQPPSVDQDEFSFIEPTMDQCLSESPWALLRSFRVVAMKLASRTSMLDQMKMQIEEKVKSSKAYTDFDTVYLQQMKLEELASEVFVTASSVSAMPVLSGPRRRKGTKRSTQSRTRKRLGSLESLPSSSPKLRNRKSANVDRRRERLTDDKIVYDMDMVHTGRTKTRSYTEGDIFIEGTVEVSAAATSTSASNENRRIGQTRRTLLETGGHGNGDADSDSFSPAPSAHKGSSTSSKSSVENESPVDDGTDLGRGGGRAMGVLDKVITPVRMSVKPMLLKMIKYTWHVRSYLLLTQQDPNPPLPPSAATDTTTPPADFDAGAPAKLGFGENADMIDRVYTQQTGKCLHRMGRHKNVNALSKGWNKADLPSVHEGMEESTNFFNAEFDEGKTGDDDDEEMSREMMGFKIGCDDRVLNVMGVMYKSRYNTEPRFHLNWARSIANMLVRHMKGLQAIMNIYLYRRPYSSDDCTIHGASSLMLSESTGKTYSSIVSKGTGKGNIKKLPATEISDIGKKGLLEHVTAYRKRSLKARANPWVNYDWIGLYPAGDSRNYEWIGLDHFDAEVETEWDPAPNGPSPLANADKASTVMYPALLCEMIERSAPFKASTLFANMNEGRDTDTGANGIDEDKLLDWEGLGYPIMLSNVCEKMTSGYKTVSLPCERFFPSKAFTRLFEGTFREMRGVAHQMNEIILDMEVDILELGVLTSEDQDPTRFKEQALKVHALLVGFMDYIASDTSDLAALGVKQTEWVEKTLVSFRKAFDYTPEFVDQTRSLVETEILRYGVSAEVDRSPKAAGAPHLSPREASFVTGVWHAANEFTPGKISERKSRLIETFTDNRAMMAGMYLPPVAITYTFVAELHTQSNDPCHPDTSALYLEKMWHLEAKSYTEGYVWSKCTRGRVYDGELWIMLSKCSAAQVPLAGRQNLISLDTTAHLWPGDTGGVDSDSDLTDSSGSDREGGDDSSSSDGESGSQSISFTPNPGYEQRQIRLEQLVKAKQGKTFLRERRRREGEHVWYLDLKETVVSDSFFSDGGVKFIDLLSPQQVLGFAHSMASMEGKDKKAMLFDALLLGGGSFSLMSDILHPNHVRSPTDFRSLISNSLSITVVITRAITTIFNYMSNAPKTARALANLVPTPVALRSQLNLVSSASIDFSKAHAIQEASMFLINRNMLTFGPNLPGVVAIKPVFGVQFAWNLSPLLHHYVDFDENLNNFHRITTCVECLHSGQLFCDRYFTPDHKWSGSDDACVATKDYCEVDSHLITHPDTCLDLKFRTVTGAITGSPFNPNFGPEYNLVNQVLHQSDPQQSLRPMLKKSAPRRKAGPKTRTANKKGRGRIQALLRARNLPDRTQSAPFIPTSEWETKLNDNNDDMA